MVGVLGLGNGHPPAADIRRPGTSGSAASPKSAPSPREQTLPVSTDNTSGSGLHFFSLPHWARRILPASSSARKSLAGLPRTDEHNANPRSTSPRRLLREKDLPPIPSPQADVDATGHQPGAQPNEARIHATDALPQPTFYLDVYHHTPVASPPSQTNSVALTSFPSGSTENVLRKSKSTHSLRPERSSSNEQQRTRGVSMTQMFMKTKRAPTSTSSGNAPSTPLARKSSFWLRKFSTSSPQHLTVPPESPSIPAFKPVSPLRVDFATPPDPLARSQSNSSGPRLSRRHSERAVRRPSIARANAPSLPQSPVSPDRTHVRPSTADPHILVSRRLPTRRPTTADSTTPSRSRSLFALSQQSTIPPSNDERCVANPTSRPKIGTPNPRPRSSTNPPLLHRLSVNLFASLPSSATHRGTFSAGVASSPTSHSPRPSLSQISPDVLKPRANESSETFVNRLVSLVSKADIAGVLASA